MSHWLTTPSHSTKKMATIIALLGILASMLAAVINRGSSIIGTDSVLGAALVGLWLSAVLLLLRWSARTPLAAVVGGTIVSVVSVWGTWSAVADTHSTAALWMVFFPVELAACFLVVAIFDRIAVIQGSVPSRPEPIPAYPGDRLAALFIDVALFGVVMGLPLVSLSHQEQESFALVLGVSVAILYFGLMVSLFRGTIGHKLLKLEVIHSETDGYVPLLPSLVRGFVIVIELIGTVLLFLAPVALLDFVLSENGRSLADRLTRAGVIAHR